MAGNGWRTSASVSKYLRKHCQEFEFAQAVRLLCAERSARRFDLETIDKVLRFGSHNGDEFPVAEVATITKTHRTLEKVVVAFFGLLGQQGPLPQPYQQWVRENVSNNDNALADFLDIFNHRLIALLFMVLAKNRGALQSSDPRISDQASYLNAIVGHKVLHREQLRTLPMVRRGLHYCSGLLANERISLPRVRNILQAHLSEPVFIEQFTGGWLRLEESQTTILRTRPAKLGKRLGRDAVLGNKVWDQSAGISLFLGPLTWSRFKELLPGQKKHRQLRQLLLFLTDKRWCIQLYLLLDDNEVPRSMLARNSREDTRLGLSVWLNSSARMMSAVKENLMARWPEKLRKRVGQNVVFTKLQFSPEHFSESGVV